MNETYQSFKRLLNFITNNCLQCKKGNKNEGYSTKDELYCDICNIIENRIDWADDSKLSNSMKKRMNYPDGPCSEIKRVDRG